MPQVAPVILPEMYKIFIEAHVYSIRTRSRAVNIFTTCTTMIANMDVHHKVGPRRLKRQFGANFFTCYSKIIVTSLQFFICSQRNSLRVVDFMHVLHALIHLLCRNCILLQGIAKQLLYPVLTQFTQAFTVSLQAPDGPTSDSGLKMEILKVLQH